MKLIISLRTLVLKDLMGYGTELNDLATESNIQDLLTSKPYIRFKESFVKLSDGFMISRRSLLTDTLMELDHKRDRSYKGLHLGMQSFLFSDVAAELQAAKTLNILFEQYGMEFLDGTYVGETSTLASFVEDLKKTENAAAIAALKLEAKQTQLVNDIASFNTAFQQSLADKSNHDCYIAASTLRNNFETETRVFLSYVQGKLLEDADAKWEQLSAKIVALNEKVAKSEAMRQTALQKKREAKKKEKENQKTDGKPDAHTDPKTEGKPSGKAETK